MTNHSYRISWNSAQLDGVIALDFSQIFDARQAGTLLELTLPKVGNSVNSEENIHHYVHAKMAFAHATGISLARASSHFDQQGALHVLTLEEQAEASAVIKRLQSAGYITYEQALSGFRTLARAMDAAADAGDAGWNQSLHQGIPSMMAAVEREYARLS